MYTDLLDFDYSGFAAAAYAAVRASHGLSLRMKQAEYNLEGNAVILECETTNTEEEEEWTIHATCRMAHVGGKWIILPDAIVVQKGWHRSWSED